MANKSRVTGRLASSSSRLKSSSSTSSNLDKQISNYKTRLSAVGADTDTRDPFEKLFNLPDDQNILFDIFEILGRPQQALFGAIDSAQKGEDIGKGALEGLTGDKDTSGGQLLRNAGLSDKGIIGDVGLDDILGFGLDVFADPMDLAIFPVAGASKAAKAANTASDVVKAASTASDVAKAADSGTQLKSLTDILFSSTGKAIKKGAGLADNLVEKGLGKLDTLQNAKVDKLASQAGVVADASLKTNLLDDYKTLKKQISGVIDSSKALPNNMVGKAREGTNAAEFAKLRSNQVLDNLVNNTRAYAENIAKTSNRNVDEVMKEVSENITKVIESDMDTSIDGAKWLKNISSKKGTNVLSGTDETITKVSQVLDNYPSIKYTIRDGARGKELVIKTKNSKLLNDFKNNSDIQNTFKNLNLQRSLNYTDEQLANINKLKSDKNFMQLVDNTKKAYQDVSDIIKQETGVDFSTIVNRPGYVRRAEGDLKDTTGQLSSYYRGPGVVNEKSFSSRTKIDPAEVENLRAQENISNAITKNKRKVESLTNSLSYNKKQILDQQLESVSREIGETQAKMKARLDKLDARQIKKYESLNKTRQARTQLRDALSDDIIKKASKIKDPKLSNTFLNDTTKLADSTKTFNNLMKQLENTDKLTPKQVDSLLNKAAKAEERMLKLEGKLKVSSAKVAGAIDDTTLSIMDKSIKSMDKSDNLTEKLIKQNDTYAKLVKDRTLIQESFTDRLSNLKQKQKDLELSIGAIDATKDEYKLKEISNIQKSIEVLESQQGKNLFDLDAMSGLQDFINRSTANAKGAKLYNEALLTGTLYDKNLIKTADDLVDGKLPSGFVRVDTNKIAKQIDSIKGILPDNSTALVDFANSLSDKTVYMDKNLANLFKIGFNSSQQMSPILKMINSFNNTFKKFKILTPGFQIRNITGNAVNLALSGVPTSQIPGLYKDASKILNNMDSIIQKANQGLETLSKSELADYELIRQFYQGGFANLGTSLQDLNEVLTQSSKSKNALNKLVDLNGKWNSQIDALNRMALLKYANENKNFVSNLGLSSPIEAVRYALMDPENMSDFEKNVVKKIIPFYTFTKQNLLFQGSNILKNSSKYYKLVKGYNSIYGDLSDDEYYQYQKEGFQLPLPWADDDGLAFPCWK